MTKIVVLDDYQQVAEQYGPWNTLGADTKIIYLHEHISDREALISAVADAEIIVAMRERTPFDADMLRDLPNLRLLVTTGMKNASIDIEAATALGITVCGTGSSRVAAAEMTWALVLASARHIPRESAALAEGKWQTTVGTQLHGKTLGIIGLGRIGTQIAHYAQAFGMTVLAWSPHLDPAVADQVGARAVTKAELLSSSDIVTIHLKLGARSRGIIGTNELAAMRRGAILINTARGPIVNEQALAVALHAGVIAGAAVDVFSAEPLPADHPLRSAPNIILTPHLGYVTDGSYRSYFEDAVEDIHEYLAGSPVRVLSHAPVIAPAGST